MPHSPAQRLQHNLEKRNITAQQFSDISGMPLTEVKSILKGELPVTILRAHHLAAALNTKPEVWLPEKIHSLQ